MIKPPRIFLAVAAAACPGDHRIICCLLAYLRPLSDFSYRAQHHDTTRSVSCAPLHCNVNIYPERKRALRRNSGAFHEDLPRHGSVDVHVSPRATAGFLLCEIADRGSSFGERDGDDRGGGTMGMCQDGNISRFLGLLFMGGWQSGWDGRVSRGSMGKMWTSGHTAVLGVIIMDSRRFH